MGRMMLFAFRHGAASHEGGNPQPRRSARLRSVRLGEGAGAMAPCRSRRVRNPVRRSHAGEQPRPPNPRSGPPKVPEVLGDRSRSNLTCCRTSTRTPPRAGFFVPDLGGILQLSRPVPLPRRRRQFLLFGMGGIQAADSPWSHTCPPVFTRVSDRSAGETRKTPPRIYFKCPPQPVTGGAGAAPPAPSETHGGPWAAIPAP